MKTAKTLKPRQLTAIKLLATGLPAYQVAERLEITSMTLYRWRRLPEFEETLSSLCHSGLQELAQKMNAASLTAVETLHELLCDMTTPATTRMKAAIGILESMPTMNAALENGLQHRTADFDPRERFTGPAFTHDSGGRPHPIYESHQHLSDGQELPDHVLI